jgi:hypothetical protein
MNTRTRRTRRTKKSTRTKITRAKWDNCSNAAEDLKDVGETAYQALDSLPVRITCDDIHILPRHLKKAVSKAYDKLHGAAYELTDVAEDIERWLSDHMDGDNRD